MSVLKVDLSPFACTPRVSFNYHKKKKIGSSLIRHIKITATRNNASPKLSPNGSNICLARFQGPLFLTALPTSFPFKYESIILLDDIPHQTVHFGDYNCSKLYICSRVFFAHILQLVDISSASNGPIFTLENKTAIWSLRSKKARRF